MGWWGNLWEWVLMDEAMENLRWLDEWYRAHCHNAIKDAELLATTRRTKRHFDQMYWLMHAEGS